MNVLMKTWEIYESVGTAACATGHIEVSDRMFAAALELCDGVEHMVKPKIKTLTKMADARLLRQNLEDAFVLYKRVLNMLARTADATQAADRWIQAHALQNIAHIYAARSATADALKYIQKSERILTRLVAPEHPQLRRVKLQIAIWQNDLGDTRTAEKLLKTKTNR